MVEAEARAQCERQKAERLCGKRLALPRYWQRSAAERNELGFALHPISSERNCDIWRPLSRCQHVPNPGWRARIKLYKISKLTKHSFTCGFKPGPGTVRGTC